MSGPRLCAAIQPPAASPAGAPGAALAAEAARIARALGAELQVLSWREDGAGSGGGPDAERIAAVLAEALKQAQPDAVILADTVLGRELAPRLACHLGCGAILGCSDVVAADEGLMFVKPVHGGWLETPCRAAPGLPVVATLDLAGVEAPQGGAPAEGSGAAAVEDSSGAAWTAAAETVDVPAAGELDVRRIELVPPDPRSVDLVHAKRIVAVGAGSAGGGLLEAVRELAELLEGSLGATRPVVDEGRLPKERLIGQTGKTVGPGLYLALGVSGSPHHVAGVQRAGRIVSINLDVRAPIFGFSDVGYVADLEAVLPLLIAKIRAWRDGAEDADGDG